MKTRTLAAAVVAGAALAIGGGATAAFAEPSYFVDPGLHGGHVRPKAGVYEMTGEYDYYRKVVSADVTVAAVVVNYETYDSNYYDTTEEQNTVTVSRTGVRRTDKVQYWGAASSYSVETTQATVDPATGVTVGDKTATGDCDTGTWVNARPLRAPLQPDVVDDSEC
jgi:hypothetical protein